MSAELTDIRAWIGGRRSCGTLCRILRGFRQFYSVPHSSRAQITLVELPCLNEAFI
jgi:hypothetical protein